MKSGFSHLGIFMLRSPPEQGRLLRLKQNLPYNLWATLTPYPNFKSGFWTLD